MKIITQLSCLEMKNKIEKEYMESSKQPSTFFYTTTTKKKTGKDTTLVSSFYVYSNYFFI